MDAMTKEPIEVAPDTTLQECSQIMANNHVGSLVVRENGKLKGVLTEQDIVRKAVAVGMDMEKTSAGGIMVKGITIIEPEKDIYDALVLMKKLNIRHLPVVKNGEMVGLLTLKDILKIEPQLFDLLHEKFEIREAERKPIHRFIPTEGICQACGEYAEKVDDIKGILLCNECKDEQS